MNNVLCLIPLCLCACLCFGQHEGVDPQRLTDELFAFPDVDSDEEHYENTAQILASPYDLNRVSREELRSIHLLTDAQIENLLAYRLQQGRLLSLYELQVITGFDLATISKLTPFVKVIPPRDRINTSLLQRIFAEGHSYFIARYGRTLESRSGFRRKSGRPPAYTGSADHVYWRLRSSVPGDFSIGLTGEKDAGEPFMFTPRQNYWGFDFTSWHVQLRNKGTIQNVIIGDFQTQFGQGLLLGGAFGLGKGSESVSTIRKSNLGFLPYTSINENACLRGLALSLRVKDFTISSFLSRTGRDASLDGISDTAAVTAFQQSGYHRTTAELERRKKIREQNAGLILQYSRKRLDIGVVSHATRFERRVEKEPTLYNQYAFTGKQNLNIGFFANGHLQHLSFFTEVGHSLSTGSAVIAGVLFTPHPKLDIGIIYRNYARNFHSFYANVLSENTQPQNERGVYWGWKYRWNKRYSFSGYFDLFRFPWLGFRRYSPSQGYEWLVRANYQPSKRVSLFVTLREESKDRNLKMPVNVFSLAPGEKRNFTVSGDYGIGEHIRLKSRVQVSQYDFNEKVTKGIALIQDFVVSVGRLTFTGRHAVFDTEDHDNRNYVYEHDVWLAYSLPSYSGTGVRNYALIQYKASKRLTFWVRYARTAMLTAEEIGTANDLIAGNTKNDVKFQARFSF